MEITNIQIWIANNGSSMKAVAAVTFNNDFCVHDIKLVQGSKGLFMSMPSRVSKDGKHHDIAHCINNEFRSKLQEAVIEAYKKALEEQQ